MPVRHALKRVAYAAMPRVLQEAIDRRFYYLRLARGDLSREAEFSLLPMLVGDGDTAIDVGANIGGYTVRLSQLVGPSGRVYAFEPVPRTFRLLAYNVERLAPHPNVRLREVAVSDRTGTASLSLPLEGSLENFYTASLAATPSSKVRRIIVPTTTLDECMPPDGGRVALIKIDTEGAEWQVLQGATDLLRRERPAVICEVGAGIERFGHTAQEVFDLMADLGYSGFRLADGSLRRRYGPDDLRLPNYVYLHRREIERLSVLVATA